MILGIDVGTTAVKAVLLEENTGVLDGVEVAHEVQCPHPGWAEQWPEDGWNGWVKAVCPLTARWGNAISGVRHSTRGSRRTQRWFHRFCREYSSF